ncbi:MAG TPA: peptidylprolyl isomerase [Myxococcota bacterium]|nr:peptidylprolyl isomerase [Myxococcota bacterium]
MLDTIRRAPRWVARGLLLLLAAVFVFYLGLSGPLRRAGAVGRMGGGGGYLVALDDRHYGFDDLRRVRENQERQLKASLGDGFNPAAAGPYLDQMAADQIIQRAVLASEAERLGLRVSDDEVRELVRSVFRGPDGTFDAQAVRAYASREFGGEAHFVDEVKDDILAQKLLELVDATADVSNAEVRDAIRYRHEQVRLAIVALDSAKLPDGVEVSNEEIEKVLGQSDRVRKFYDEHSDRYHVPERVRARHILLRLEKDAPDDKVADVKKRAEAALARVRGGEDFAAVAREVSEDPGSKLRGGDLGFFPRGQMAKPFEDVAFTLEPGKTSDLVRTDFGYHVIRVEAHEPAKDQSFDEEARPIAEELARSDRAAAIAQERADQLAAAVRGGQSLVDAARAAGVAIERPDWVARRPDGQLANLGPAPDVMALAFALTPEKPSSDRVFEVGSKRVLIELLERREPDAEEMTKDLGQARDALLEARRAEARSRWLQAARDRLVAEGRLAIDLTPLQEEQKQRAKEAS